MDALWSRSSTLGAKQKAFSWRIDSRGNIFIKRKFRHARFPRIDKISCSHLNKLDGFMQDREWKDLANNAAKLHRRTEKEGVGNFLYRLRPEVSYAHLSSQLGAIFYRSGAWEWNEQKRGMQFQLLPGDWKEKTLDFYRSSLEQDHGFFLEDRYPEALDQVAMNHEAGEKGDECRRTGQARLSAFFSV